MDALLETVRAVVVAAGLAGPTPAEPPTWTYPPREPVVLVCGVPDDGPRVCRPVPSGQSSR